MEARLCEQGGHPSLCAGRMGEPRKQNSGLLAAEWQPKITDGVTGNRLVTLAFNKVSTWTSAASPGPAPSRSEAFLFSSFRKYRKESDQSNYYFSLTVHSAWFRLPFSEGPWLLAWGMEGGWVCISGFCQWSSSGFPQWTEATIKQKQDSLNCRNASNQNVLNV